MQKIIKRLIVILITTLLASCTHSYDQTFEFEPSTFNPGDEVTIYYNSKGTPLADADSIELTACFFNNKLVDSQGFIMTKEDSGFVCQIKTNSEADGLIIKFNDLESDKFDNNNNEGYLVPINEIRADAGYAVALNSWGYNLEMDNNREKAFSILDKVLNRSPELLTDFGDSYFNVVWRIKVNERDSIISGKLAKLEELNKGDESTLTTLTSWYKNIGNNEKLSEYRALLNEKYPHNSIVEMDKFRLVRGEQDLQVKVQMANEFKNEFQTSKLTGDLFYYVLDDFRKQGKIAEGIEIIKQDPALPHRYTYTRYIDECLEKENFGTALELANLEVELAQKDLSDPKAGDKPENSTAREWEKDRKSALGSALAHLAEAQLKNSDLEAALISAGKAVELTDAKEIEINLSYVKLLIATGKNEEAFGKLIKFSVAGHSNGEMKDLLKETYIKQHGGEDGFSVVMDDVEKQAMAGLYEKLQTKMIKETAPGFSLTNIKGESVSLEELKGKIVIIDFWATWCGPCRQSFPGMKQAVEKFADNDNVKFLFINSWERVENKLETAAKFIKENNYPFNVLMDTDNSVITSFKVSGIPTKFVIDGTGNIRFKLVGFDGNTDHVADEISAMVKLASES